MAVITASRIRLSTSSITAAETIICPTLVSSIFMSIRTLIATGTAVMARAVPRKRVWAKR